MADSAAIIEKIITGTPGCRIHLARVKRYDGRSRDADTLCGRFLMDVMVLDGGQNDWPWDVCRLCDRKSGG
jgi:hypothetical protein